MSAVAQWYYPAESNLRINVKPREASVYVDGYYAGIVDDFDGQLQRLHVTPGHHELVIYLKGYHSLKQELYLSPNATRTIAGTLEKLAPGDPPEAEPRPTEPERLEAPPEDAYRQPPPPPQRRPLPPRPTNQPPTEPAPRSAPAEPSQFGALSLRVEPGGVAIRVDGERWEGPSGDERLIVQVHEGHHVIEADREGYERYTTDVEVHAGETVPISITLKKR
jgi:PEGA domain-containing protein